jgi:hypothetical protein
VVDAEVSEAGIDFGRSMCLPPEREWLPLEQLTPDEAACALRVGRSFEERVDRALGAEAPADGPTFPVQTPSGKTVARLSMDRDGNVLLCIPDRSCAVVGEGVTAAVAAEQTLALMGLQVGSEPANS